MISVILLQPVAIFTERSLINFVHSIHQEITTVYICRIRLSSYVIKPLNDIYMSHKFEPISLRRIIFYPTYTCCIDYYATYNVIQHIFLNNI